MAGLPQITGEFRLGGDPELRFTPAGKAVVNFSGVANKRIKNGDDWVDGPPTWLRFSAWDKMAENIAESLTKGSLVFITGELESRPYTPQGSNEERLSWEVSVRSIGPSLKWDAARILKSERTGGQGNAGQGSQAAGQAAAGQGNQDPWGAPSTDDSQPPF